MKKIKSSDKIVNQIVGHEMAKWFLIKSPWLTLGFRSTFHRIKQFVLRNVDEKQKACAG